MICHDARAAAAAGDVAVGFDDECTLAVLTAQLQQLHDVSYGVAGDFSCNDAGDVSCNDADGCDGERSGYINGIAAAADENHNDNDNYVLLQKPNLHRYPHVPTYITPSFAQISPRSNLHNTLRYLPSFAEIYKKKEKREKNTQNYIDAVGFKHLPKHLPLRLQA